MFLCERRSCKHKIATPGIAMIHKLDIHSGSARLEDMSGTPVATTLETTTRTILQHVSSVASNVRIDKCSIVFRVSASVCLLHSLYFCHCSEVWTLTCDCNAAAP